MSILHVFLLGMVFGLGISVSELIWSIPRIIIALAKEAEKKERKKQIKKKIKIGFVK